MDRSREVLARMRAAGPPAILISALLVGLLVSAEVRGLVISGAARTIASGVVGMTAPHLVPDPSGGAATVEDLDALDVTVRQRIAVNQVIAYRLRALDGTLLYAAPAPSGPEAPPTGRAFAGAVRGEVGVDLTDDDDDPAVPDDAGTVMKVYAPIGLGGEGGRTIAVAEVYKPYAPIARSVRDSVLAIWFVVGLGAIVTAGTLGFVARRAYVQIAHNEQQVSSLNGRLESSLLDLEHQSLGVLQSLSAAVDAKDSYTARHALGVTDIAHRIGRELGLSTEEQHVLERAALLHDIGKIGVAEAILLKPAALTDEEFERIKEHPETGARILETIPFLAEVVPVVRYHHERWDGAGYPGVLSGADIPLLARILAAADAYDAMTTNRPYRSATTASAALAEIDRNAGTQFDPAVAAALTAALSPRVSESAGVGPVAGT